MPVLNLADDVKVGASQVDKVYLGAEQVWTSAPETATPIAGIDYSDLDRREVRDAGDTIMTAGIVAAEVSGTITDGVVDANAPHTKMYAYYSPQPAEVTISGLPALRSSWGIGYFSADKLAAMLVDDPPLLDFVYMTVEQFEEAPSVRAAAGIVTIVSGAPTAVLVIAATPTSAELWVRLFAGGDDLAVGTDSEFTFDPEQPHVYTIVKEGANFRVFVDLTELDLTWDDTVPDVAALGPWYVHTTYLDMDTEWGIEGFDATYAAASRHGQHMLYRLLTDSQRTAAITALLDKWVNP